MIPFLFSSGVEHQKADWVGIHDKICQSLIALRQGAPFLPSEEERQKREKHILMKKVRFTLVLSYPKNKGH